MNLNEIKQAIAEMSPEDFTSVVEIVEERKVVFRKQEIAEFIKKINIGTYASYMRGKVEIIGEIVAINKKNVFLEISEGDKVHKRTLAFEDIFRLYAERPLSEEIVVDTTSKKPARHAKR